MSSDADDPRSERRPPEGERETSASPTESRGPESPAAGQVGPYRLLRKLGQGGMGEVWEAEQQRPVRRKVALKLIKRGMDTESVVARFESERQALALMNHANIARVFEAGATDEGRPYFAMELVRGEPITAYCDRHRLPTDERLGLFLDVCEAVQHAHQKGVIHRDLKPGNVLVSIQDGRPIPKVIDFGVAKAIERPLTERSPATELGALIGTPEYMSPEQAEMSVLDIDTRTDVYSLGIVLYELIVGALPYDPARLRQAGYGEMQRIIREEDPPRPSTRLTTLATAGEAAERRRTDPRTLARRLEGDLDWIAMRALEKDRTRRYGSASELAADIRRHLAHEPVTAGPPGAAYRLQKFVRRHRAAVIGAAAMLTTLIVGLVGLGYGLVRAHRAEARTRLEAETAEQVSRFLEGLFQVSDPGQARGSTITAREILDEGKTRIDRELQDQPLVQARLMGTMGRVYQSLGLFDEAEPLLKRALEIRRAQLGERHLDVARSLADLSDYYYTTGNLDAARPLSRQALQLRSELLDDDDPLLADSLAQVAAELIAEGRYDEVREYIDRALQIRREALGPGAPAVADLLNMLGNLHALEQDQPAARQAWEQALAIQEATLPADHPDLAWTLTRLGTSMQAMGELDEARVHLERAARIMERALGPDHFELAGALNNLGRLLVAMGDYAAARPLLERAERILAASTPDNPVLALVITSQAELAVLEQRHEDAERLYRRSLAILERSLGPEHRQVGWNLAQLAELYRRQGARIGSRDRGAALREAERLSRRSLQIWDANLAPGDPDRAYALENLGLVLLDLDEVDEALGLFERSLALREQALGEDHPLVATSLERLGIALRTSGRHDEAQAVLRRAVSIRAQSDRTNESSR